MMAGFADNGLHFVELRSSVLYLATLQGCSPTEALKALIKSTGKAAERRGIRRGLILTVTRGHNGAGALDALLQAYQNLGRPGDVVGLDLAGDEEVAYSADLPRLFRQAKDRFGLGVTIHAGETGRVSNVRAAVELFHADRIGHGTAAGSDPDTLEFLATRDICVEVCPISNRLTGAVRRGEAHPLVEFRRHGVPFVICSDNPGIHGHGLADDQSAAIGEGLSVDDLARQYALAVQYSFIRDLH
jgi:adenosine deaminase